MTVIAQEWPSSSVSYIFPNVVRNGASPSVAIATLAIFSQLNACFAGHLASLCPCCPQWLQLPLKVNLCGVDPVVLGLYCGGGEEDLDDCGGGPLPGDVKGGMLGGVKVTLGVLTSSAAKVECTDATGMWSDLVPLWNREALLMASVNVFG